MQQRRAALQGVDVERGRRESKNNIVNARANAREERLNNKRRLENSDVAGDTSFASDSNQGGTRSIEELPNNVRSINSSITTTPVHRSVSVAWTRASGSVEHIWWQFTQPG